MLAIESLEQNRVLGLKSPFYFTLKSVNNIKNIEKQ